MGFAYRFTHPGQDGGTWYAITYPLGATRYYSTREAADAALAAYVDAIQATGGYVIASEWGDQER